MPQPDPTGAPQPPVVGEGDADEDGHHGTAPVQGRAPRLGARREATAFRERGRWSRRPLEVVDCLSGHSGCTVLLCRAGEACFVRKISASPAYNPRLRQQIAKQERLRATARTPRILAVGEVDGLVFFDMEYIPSCDLPTFVAVNRLPGLARLVDRVLAVVERLASRRRGTVDRSRFDRKIGSVAEAVAATVHYARHRTVLDRAVARLRGASWDGVPRTECHGDLTLENILVGHDGSVALIDALDGELESFWLDVAKLLHDLESGWSFRHRLWKGDLSPADRLVLLSCRFLREEFAAGAAARFPGIVPRLAELQILQALRVLPYTKERGTFARIVSSIERYVGRATT